MMRSMFAAVSGLRIHQMRMDVIADNIANVNTTGFKRARMTFQDIFYQTLRGGSAPADPRGGTNPHQIGLGAGVASIDVIQTQGAAGATGNPTDLMIQGDGFFVLTDGENSFYTRAGNFAFDANGNLVVPGSGLFLVGADGSSPISVPTEASSFSIDTFGNVSFIDPNGLNQAGTIGLVKFANPGGLKKVGENLYVMDPNAHDGEPEIGNPGADGRGTLIASALEMSNVELAQEFSEMIITQRGFQANARVITTSDEMLQELANLKR
ncbi:MAG: flagellar hook-basal body complex protein [Syntrophomonadaceae bacterium]|jgi:flagellar hook protein FlgE|nr:flagellar hook-basal body complex protein [Syntrophomonadaceae bacterium]